MTAETLQALASDMVPSLAWEVEPLDPFDLFILMSGRRVDEGDPVVKIKVSHEGRLCHMETILGLTDEDRANGLIRVGYTDGPAHALEQLKRVMDGGE